MTNQNKLYLCLMPKNLNNSTRIVQNEANTTRYPCKYEYLELVACFIFKHICIRVSSNVRHYRHAVNYYIKYTISTSRWDTFAQSESEIVISE